jgi:hypothetical protein
MSSAANAAASAATTLTVNEALDNMYTTIYQQTVCVACGEQVAPDELKIACLTRCKNPRLALPGCYCCGKCLKSKAHLGELDSEAGVWSCALCPKTADKFEASFLKEGVPVVKWSKQIAERRATPNELCWPAQPYTSGVAMKSLEVQLERAKTASTADKRAADHAIAKAAAKIEQLNAALVERLVPYGGAAQPEGATGAREAEEAAHQERIEAQRRETERRREEAELASLAATAEERAASEARKQRVAAEQELRQAQAATAAAKAAAAAAASPPDTPAGRPSAKSRFLAKEGNTEEMWLQKQADTVAKAKATRKRKAEEAEEEKAAAKAKRRRLKSKLANAHDVIDQLEQLALLKGATKEELDAILLVEEEEEEKEEEEEEKEEEEKEEEEKKEQKDNEEGAAADRLLFIFEEGEGEDVEIVD